MPTATGDLHKVRTPERVASSRKEVVSNSADLVLQFSSSSITADPVLRNSHSAEVGGLILELRQRLKPGLEIALACQGYRAITSILWVSDFPTNHTVCAGVRLLAVSVLPDQLTPDPRTSQEAQTRGQTDRS